MESLLCICSHQAAQVQQKSKETCTQFAAHYQYTSTKTDTQTACAAPHLCACCAAWPEEPVALVLGHMQHVQVGLEQRVGCTLAGVHAQLRGAEDACSGRIMWSRQCRATVSSQACALL
jgi:hypothetical protein